MIYVYEGEIWDHFKNFYLAFCVREFEIVFLFAVPVFLSSVFMPKPKKVGASITVVIMTLFQIIMLIVVYLDEHTGWRAFANTYDLLAWATMSGATAVGFAISYLVFKNRGWEKEIEKTELPETY